jgi:hypothetical protein
MSNKALKQVSTNDSKATVTNLDWDEVQKFAQVGDIIKRHGSAFELARKEFVQQMDNSFEIQLFAAE